MTVKKPKPMQLLRPITTGANSTMNQSQFLAIIWNFFKVQEKSRVHGAIGSGFASHWLKNWRESFKPITKRSNRNHVITFDSHLKTALMMRITKAKTKQNMTITTTVTKKDDNDGHNNANNDENDNHNNQPRPQGLLLDDFSKWRIVWRRPWQRLTKSPKVLEIFITWHFEEKNGGKASREN